MEPKFLVHNAHLESPRDFKRLDPQLRQLKNQVYVYHSALLNQIPLKIPGIYTIGGGRQIGKTTLLKQLMLKLLNEKIEPVSLAFFSGELISTHLELLHLLQTQLSEMPESKLRYLFLDEITYIKDWDKAIKYAADAGLFEKAIVILTGSDLKLIQEARMRFPGRRGKADKVDFHLYPLSFREFCDLTLSAQNMAIYLKSDHDISEKKFKILFDQFNAYLKHGGYLTAINDIAKYDCIKQATLTTYSDWIRGDMLKHGKQETYTKELLTLIIKKYTSQLTWNGLAQDLTINHPKTVMDYVAQLELMDALFTQQALLEDKLMGAPKKARKLLFIDPFIYHSLRAWLFPTQQAYQDQIQPAIEDSILASQLTEAVVASHYYRRYPTYYIKAEGEVDVAYVDHRKFWPIEIKWTNQLRVKDLKQIKKYKNGLILAKTLVSGKLENIPVMPLPLVLLQAG